MKVKSESKDYQDSPLGMVCQDGADCTRREGGTVGGCIDGTTLNCGIAINTIDVGIDGNI